MLRIFSLIPLTFLLTSCLVENQVFKVGSPEYKQANKRYPSFQYALQNNRNHKVIIGIIDSGVDYTSPHIAKNMHYNLQELKSPFNQQDSDRNGVTDDILGYDFTGKDGLPYYALLLEDVESNRGTLKRIIELEDMNFQAGHGTQVSGVATQGDPRIGIIPFRVLPLSKNKFTKLSDDLPPEVQAGRASNLIAQYTQQSIYMAKRQGAKIINLSLASMYAQGVFSEAALKSTFLKLRKYIASAATEMTIITAAGNKDPNSDRAWDISSGYKVQPCQLRVGNVLCVGSVNNKGQISEFSNYGQQFVDIYAPGEQIPSPIPQDYAKFYGSNPIQPFDGTSAAAPYVSHIVAKMLIESPCLTPTEIISILKGTAYKKTARLQVGNSNSNIYRYLVVNKEAAIHSAKGKTCNN